jgi:NADH:ubiquinone oxidoreductase subunit 5 (subunit L)/multisubunit Na+/H+ antiporter MnhA subunit
MAGFYSKDLIIEASININHNIVIVFIAFISLGLTSFYSVRFRLIVLWGPNLTNPLLKIKEHVNIILPTILLGSTSIVAGRAIRWMILITNNIFTLPPHLKLIPLILITTGLIVA